MSQPLDLLDRPMYGFGQVDSLLGLNVGTSRRWIDGYQRKGRTYEPIVRVTQTGNESVTWGEFVEMRCLAEFQQQGAKVFDFRKVISRLRERVTERYPLAHSHSLLSVRGREIVQRVQDEVGLENSVRLVVVRSGQLVLSEGAKSFTEATEFSTSGFGHAVRIFPQNGNRDVVVDPEFGFGQPVVRSVRTELIAEQFRAGDSVDAIADWFQLEPLRVQAALRFELGRSQSAA